MQDKNKTDAIFSRWLTQFRKGLLEYIILIKLKQKHSYGYELVTEIKKETQIDIAEGTLYPLLNRLKKETLIEAKWQNLESGSPRKYYYITDLGEQTLLKMKQEWTHTQNSIMNLIMQS